MVNPNFFPGLSDAFEVYAPAPVAKPVIDTDEIKTSYIGVERFHMSLKETERRDQRLGLLYAFTILTGVGSAFVIFGIPLLNHLIK